jgi:hypothetical protein
MPRGSGTRVMRRVLLVAACGLALAGCSSISTDWLPSMSLGGGGGVALRLESEPPGAEAVTTAGPGCRTPCAVTVPARENIAVTFNLPGYQPQTIPVQVRPAGPGSDSEFATVAELTPNPVFAQLEPAAPAAPAKRKAKPKPRTAKAPSGTSAPSSGTAPAAQQAIPGSQPTAPPSQRQIPGSQPTVPPASAWPPPSR